MWDEEADDTQTPDLQASAGLSYGGTTPQLMEMLQRMGPSPTQQAGQALAGGVAFARGQANPVTPIINQQMQQQNMVMNMLQKMGDAKALNTHRENLINLGTKRLEDAKEARLGARDKAAFDMMLGLVKDPNSSPELLAMAGPQLASMAKRMYQADLPNSIMTRTMSHEEQNNVLKDIYNQKPPELIFKNNPKLSPDDLPKFAGMFQGEGGQRLAKSLGLKTTDDLKNDELERALKTGQLLEQMMPPGFGKTAANSAKMHAAAEQKFPGVSPLDLTPKQRAEVTALVDLQEREAKLNDKEALQTQRFEQELAKMQARGEQTLANALAINAARQVHGPKPMTTPQLIKALEPYNEMSNGIGTLQMIRKQVAEMPDEAFPKGDDFASRWFAKLWRENVLGGQQSVYNMQTEIMNVMNGVVGRKYFDDKGMRVWAASKTEFENIENLPSRKTFDGLLNTLQKEMQRNMVNNLSNLEATGEAPEALVKGARAAIGRALPKEKAAQPTPMKPLAPPIEKVWMDMRPGSKNYGKPVKLRYEVGDDPATQGYMEIKP